MNCEQFQSAVLAAPNADFSGRNEHSAECAACARVLKNARSLESRLEAALNVPLPASLRAPVPDMAALAASTPAPSNVVALGVSTKRRYWQTTPVWLGLAASVLLAFVFVLRPSASNEAAEQALIAQVFEHLAPELSVMVASADSVSAERLQQVLSRQVADYEPSAGIVSYAQSCVIEGQQVPHLVVQGKNGPVTILLMPHAKLDKPMQVSRDGLQGLFLPVGAGSVAIIGRDSQSVEAVRSQTLASVRWTT